MSSPISKLRKRRGVIRASITRLTTRLKELEDGAPELDTPKHAQQLLGKLKSLDEEFRGLHYDVLDLIDGSEDKMMYPHLLSVLNLSPLLRSAL